MRIRSARDLGLLVREARRVRQFTQAQLAAKAGVGRDWVVALEKGNSGAEMGRVLRTLRALECSLEIGYKIPGDEPETKTATRLDQIIARSLGKTR
jgi:transcriptional regulator with XRE-family HTH domain